MTGQAIFSLREVSFEYSGRGLPAAVPALSGLVAEIWPGEMVAVAGANASGKTTMALILAGILPPRRGRIIYKGTDSRKQKLPFGDVSLIFQNPENTFVAPTLEEDVAFGPENASLPPAVIRRLVDGALERVGLSAFADRHPATLSGGEQQLAALAGALARSPDVLIMDEATSYLDASHGRGFLAIVKELNEKDGVTVVMTTQEVAEMWMADRLMVLDRGTLAYDGDPAGILLEPDRCRRLGLEVDPLVELSRRLEDEGFKMPGGRPDPGLIEEWIADRN